LWIGLKGSSKSTACAVVPNKQTLVDAYRRMYREIEVQKQIDKLVAIKKVPKPPRDLLAQVEAQLEDDPTLRWDDALHEIIREDEDDSI
jgi:hypothetical protein